MSDQLLFIGLLDITLHDSVGVAEKLNQLCYDVMGQLVGDTWFVIVHIAL